MSTHRENFIKDGVIMEIRITKMKVLVTLSLSGRLDTLTSGKLGKNSKDIQGEKTNLVDFEN